MIPSSPLFHQSVFAQLLDHDPVVQEYRAFFSLLDWSVVEQWEAERKAQLSARGQPAHPMSAYIKAFLIRICEGMIYTTQLHRFLLKHPLLVIELGFRLHLDESAPYGFDIEKTLPCRSWLGDHLRRFDPAVLQGLLHSTVHTLQAEIPGLGEIVACDVKHIYAWVKENNERVYVKDRYQKAQQLKGDPDCTLGVKKKTNREQADGSTKVFKEYLWGYGSGVVAATDPVYGDVVLAEHTQPFHVNDITYFYPLYEQAVVALGKHPTHLAADPAFDAWYIYEFPARHGGIGAIPLNEHGHTPNKRDPDGTPLCAKGLRMHPTYQFNHTYGYRAQRFRCPLLFPENTGASCDHEQFAKGKGCVKDVNWELGGRMRVLLDRTGPLYKGIYNQRTACERINSQAKELGIERPKVRNGRSVRHLNTLIYIVINVRALKRVRSINRGILHMN
jgi:hypothetical protein